MNISVVGLSIGLVIQKVSVVLIDICWWCMFVIIGVVQQLYIMLGRVNRLLCRVELRLVWLNICSSQLCGISICISEFSSMFSMVVFQMVRKQMVVYFSVVDQGVVGVLVRMELLMLCLLVVMKDFRQQGDYFIQQRLMVVIRMNSSGLSQVEELCEVEDEKVMGRFGGKEQWESRRVCV